MTRLTSRAGLLSLGLGFALVLAASSSYAGDDRGKKPAQRSTTTTMAKPKVSNPDKQPVASADADDQDVINASMAGSDPEIVKIRTEAKARLDAKAKPSQTPSKTTPTLINR